jgi:ribosome-associated protein
MTQRPSPPPEIDENAVEEHFILSSGPGGQNVNKVASAVQLRYALGRARGLDAAMRRRLAVLAGKKITRGGDLVITAHRFRSQERNREDARGRLLDLLHRSALAPKPRVVTGPSRAARTRRLDNKRARSRVKKLRQVGAAED